MKKNKIGILTFQNSLNFGAQLQAFALQNYICNQGYQTEIINYSRENSKFISKIIFCLKKCIKGILLNPRMFKKWKKMYNLSKEKYSDKNIADSNGIYDIFVVGSDQVWNPKFCDTSSTFLLDFTDKYKISYAASFGVSEIEKKDFLYYRNLLNRINYVSIRENSGCKLFNQLTNKNPNLVIDPTFLLSKDDWANAVNIKDKNEKYVLIYMLEYSKDLIKIGREYAKKNNMEYKIISGTPRAFAIKGVQWNMSPQKFIKLFYNSEVVFTNSFHGTCFGINFNKQLYIKLLEKNKKVNSRLTDFAKQIQIEDHILDNIEIDEIKSIDYSKVNKNLHDFIKISKEYLNNALERYDYEK